MLSAFMQATTSKCANNYKLSTKSKKNVGRIYVRTRSVKVSVIFFWILRPDIPCDPPGCGWSCPKGYTHLGVLCSKIDVKTRSTYRRSAKYWSCPHHKEKQAGLCWDPCRKGYFGTGPICTCMLFRLLSAQKIL